LQAHKEQQKKIEAYKQTNKFIESETKSLQRIYDGLPIFYSVDNDQSVVTLRANSLQPNGDLGLNLTDRVLPLVYGMVAKYEKHIKSLGRLKLSLEMELPLLVRILLM
jgi:hypothetical protein